MSQTPSKLAALEALLFLHGEPLTLAKIEGILELPAGEAAALVDAFGVSLAAEGRGLTLVRDGQKVQLATRPEFHSILQAFVKEQLTEDLTPASLETLAIIAYFGPLSRMRIDYQRGVNSTFILRSLLLRGLIERLPDPAQAQSFVYRASFDFWRHIGVNRSEELPEHERFKEILAKFSAQESLSPGE